VTAVPPAAGPLAVASLLLVAGGAAKVVRPDTTTKALRALGLPVGPLLVRTGAATELAVGLGALTAGGTVAGVLVAVSYATFVVFVTGALVRGTPLATCACFGESDTPPTALHVIVDLALATGAVLAAATHTAKPLLALDPAVAVGAGVAAYVTFLLLSALPRVSMP
jgi:hypothetical protein